MRFFTPEEADELVPQVQRAFREIDRLRGQSRRTRARLTDLEAYWGEEILRPDTPDHRTYEGLQEELEDAYKAIQKRVHEIHDIGGHVKSLDGGLVDFYAHHKGRTVLLCWQKGEPRIAFYHDLEAGFAGRKPLGEDGEA